MNAPRVRRLAALLLAVLLPACRHAALWRATPAQREAALVVRQRGSQHCVSFDGSDHGCFDGVDVRTITFDTAGRHVAYAVQRGTTWGVTVDGTADGVWDAVGPPQLSPDGKRVAYAAERAGTWRMVVDGVAGARIDSTVSGGPWFDAAGRRVAFVARRRTGERVIVDGATSPWWRAVRDVRPSPIAAASAPAFAGWSYAARDSTGWRVVRDGAPGPSWDDVRLLQYSPGGALTYVASRRVHEVGGTTVRREALATDDSVGAWHAEIALVSVGADGDAAYVARDGDLGMAVRGGRVLARGDIMDIAAGRNGRTAWVAHDSGSRPVVTAPGATYAADVFIAGTLQFVARPDGGEAWAVLAGTRATRSLSVIVDGVDTGVPFDWSETMRRVQQREGSVAIVTWVRAQATRWLARRAQVPPDTACNDGCER